MIIERERLDGALTPEQYIESMKENRAVFEENLAAVRLTDEERAFFAELPEKFGVLVLTEDWCGDSAANLPIVVALARETGKLDVRILRREGNEDIANRYKLADGRNHIPTYIVHDAELNEVGHAIERPAEINDDVSGFKLHWFGDHPGWGDSATSISTLEPEQRQQFGIDQRAFRRTLRDREQRALIAAFRAIAERTLAPA
jgi:hypothetical protein